MTALCIVLGILVLLLLLAWAPVGVRAAYHGDLRVQVKAGPLRFSVYPPPKEKPSKKAEKKASAPTGDAKKRSLRRPSRRQLLSAQDTLPPSLGRALGRVGRRLRVPVLRLRVVFGGEDPADVALLYGRAQAAAGAALPVLEQLVRFGETDVRLETDYQAERTEISGEAAVEIRLGALLGMGCAALRDVLAWLRGYRALAGEKKVKPSADAASAA